MNLDLINQANDSGVEVSGSLLAVPGRRRLFAAEELWAAGAWVHVDVLQGNYAHQEGVDETTIGELHRMNPEKTDIHLMVDDPIHACENLPIGFGRITIQIGANDAVKDVIKAARSRTNSIWLATDETFSYSAVTSLAEISASLGVEGILVMLAPPGQPGQSASKRRIDDLRKLRLVTKLQLGADGGVNAENFNDVISAGSTYLVSGRALMAAD